MADKEQTQDNQPMPNSMGVEEALDFMMSKDQGTKDSSGVAATEEEREEEESPQEVEDDEAEEEETEEEGSEDSEEDEEEPDDEDDDSDEEDEDDEEESDEEDEEDFFTVMDGDEEIKVTREEAKAGYMRQKAFTQKTQEVAKERKAVEEEKVGLLETKAKYLEALGGIKASMSEQLKDFIGIDWKQLEQDDPMEFEEKERELRAAQLAYENATKAEEEERQKLVQETMEYAQTVRKEELGKLAEHFPEVMEADNKLLESVREFGIKRYGFTEEELLSIYDHRMIRVLADALKVQNVTDKVTKGKEKLKSKTMKPKATRSKTMAKARKAKATKAALNKPGGVTIDEALGLIMRG